MSKDGLRQMSLKWGDMNTVDKKVCHCRSLIKIRLAYSLSFEIYLC